MTQTGRSAQLKLAAFAGVGTALAMAAVSLAFGVRLNTSPSLPTGLYIARTGRPANIAVFCPAEPYASLALQRGYREAGSCSDGGTPLMKPIVAEAGDVVVFRQDGLAVNGQVIRNSSPRTTDSRSRPLDHFPFGTYRLPPGAVWVSSEYNARSYDSRYFGPISTSLIQARVAPLVTLD